MAEALQLLGLSQSIYCLPSGVTTGQVRDIWIKYMQDHPEARHISAELLYLASMKEVYPCSPTPTKKP